jgi:hypothetical protein
MKQFRSYLQELPVERLPTDLDGIDLATFHYGSWLLERGFDFKADRESTPLFWEYMRFQRQAIAGYFAELSDYIKEYGRSKGRDVLVSGNLYYVAPPFYPFEPMTDVLITEMNQTRYRQPVWCRYAAGFARGKPVTVVENPFGGVGPELLPKLQRGGAYDLFRMMQYEAAALGINMSVPYGAWMGAVIEDSFWAPHEVVVEIQDFIADNEHLFATDTWSEVAVAFSVRSSHDWLEAHGWGVAFPFWTVGEALVSDHQPFDVVMLPDGVLREDVLTASELARYRTLILPECAFLTPAQVTSIRGYLEHGGRVISIGELGLNLDRSVRDDLDHTNLVRSTELDVMDLADGPQVRVEPLVDLGISIHRPRYKEAAIHVIRYDHDEELDRVPVLPRVHLDVRLPRPFHSAQVFSPDGNVGAGPDLRSGPTGAAPDRPRERPALHRDPAAVERSSYARHRAGRGPGGRPKPVSGGPANLVERDECGDLPRRTQRTLRSSLPRLRRVLARVRRAGAHTRRVSDVHGRGRSHRVYPHGDRARRRGRRGHARSLLVRGSNTSRWTDRTSPSDTGGRPWP